MTKLQAKALIKENLTPKFENARNSAIHFCIRDRDTIMNSRAKLKELDSNSSEYKELYTFLHGYFDKETKKQVKGFILNLNKTNFKLIMDRVYSSKPTITDKEIQSFYKKEYNLILKNVVDGIYEDIKKVKPTNIELGLSEHDINLILTIAKEKRSYTINTIVAGGEIQCLHNRVLKKLHNKIV